MIFYKDFYETISKTNSVLDCYFKLSFAHNNETIYKFNNKLNTNNKTINVSLFPTYLKPKFSNTDTVEVVKIPQKKITGYAILINNYVDLETFFKEEYKKSFRANILRFVNRFESCFNAKYKLFYGAITKDNYEFLMNSLQMMLTTRFNQRNDFNKVLNNWSTYFDTTYNLILEKKASIYVIYHNTTPVHICINYHFNNILFVSVPSYDINYSKFALGNISLYKLLEWSVNNKYEIMDMEYGYLEYKRRWSNLIYNFEHHIVYSNKSFWNQILAKIEIQKLYFKNYLKSKNIDTLVENTKKRLKKNNTYHEDLLYKFVDVDKKYTSNVANILENSDTYNKIKKPINDFLYTHKEHSDDVKVLELIKDKEYFLDGKHTAKKLLIVV